MFKLRLREWLLPIMVLAFVGLAVTFLTPVFKPATRWAVLGFAAAYLAAKGSLWYPLRSNFGLLTLMAALWIFGTVAWSEVPLLSFLKAGAFLLVTFTCMAAGQMWVRHHPLHNALQYLLPLTLVALSAGIFGRYSAHAVVESGATTMYQGLVGGPNMFGSMLAMCSPFLIWQTYSYWHKSRKREIWLILSFIGLYYLMAASSRGAILVVLSTMFGLFLSLGVSRRVHLTIMFVGLVAIGYMLAPGKFEQMQRQFIYKQATKEQGVLHTREAVWEVSYENAKKGGWTGAGYGVTIGETNFEEGLSAENYGREKGNSQLAIVEETGLIGLTIYLLSLIVLFARLVKTLMRWPRGPERVLLSIVTGTLFGMTMQSFFEAWWVAPGSPESAYFWILAGVALGLSRLKLKIAKRVQPAATNKVGRSPLRHGSRPASI